MSRIPSYVLKPPVLLYLWFASGLFGISASICYVIFGPGKGGDFETVTVCLVVGLGGAFLYSLPTVLARVSAHPSRGAIYFIDIAFGWSLLGWVIALVWSLVGFSDRMADIQDARKDAVSRGEISWDSAGYRFVANSGSTLGTVIAIVLAVYIYWLRSNHDAAAPGAMIVPNESQAQVMPEQRPSRSAQEAIKESDAEELKTFQKEILELEHPELNLVWFPESGGILTLVTPFGPCAFIVGSDANGYSVNTIDALSPNSLSPARILGHYTNFALAKMDARVYCRSWYTKAFATDSGKLTDATEWFPPEDLNPPPTDNKVDPPATDSP